MGIPSYFSFIVKNYSSIIKNLSYFYDVNNQLDHLYMDCNSIIYDIVNKENYTNNDFEYEKIIIELVIKKIVEYINYIKPKKSVYITFDGVAPFAKMKQQRTRRYKNIFLNKLENNTNKWNTSKITPGTEFMVKLTNALQLFKDKWNNNIILNISGVDSPGEGEHKLFNTLREQNNIHDTYAVYGLDSDLLMLSIFNLQYSKNIYVFREAPEFLKNTMLKKYVDLQSNFCFMDIKEFTYHIQKNMECKYNSIRRTYDYIFICFLLGNDFLPHIPSLNIRTHGIQVLLDVYKKYIGNDEDKYLVSEKYSILWRNVKLYICELSKIEHTLLLQEYKQREKFNNYTDGEINNIPIKHKYIENYICPTEDKWEERYYNSLFHLNRKENKKDISNNYIQGLEWVFKYYTYGCIDWKWSYEYDYPPLLIDLCKYISDFDIDFNFKDNKPYLDVVQLSYVLPRENLKLLSNDKKEYILKNYNHLYPEKYDFKFAFCRYFWESHPVLPNISINIMNKLEQEFTR